MTVIRILLLLLLIAVLIPHVVSQKVQIKPELPTKVLTSEIFNQKAVVKEVIPTPAVKEKITFQNTSKKIKTPDKKQVFIPETFMPEVSPKECIPESRFKEEITLQDILEKMDEAYKKVEDYQCICIIQQLSRLGKKMYKAKVIELSFKRPDMMHAIGLQGVEKDAEAVYRDGKIKGTHRRYVPFIVFTFDADSAIARSPRHGFRVDRVNLGGIIERVSHNYNEEYQTGKAEFTGIEKIEGREAYRLVIIPIKKDGKHPITKEIFWVDKEKFLPIQHAVYEEEDKLAERQTFKDLRINIGLSDELFEPPKARWRRKKKE